MTFCVVALRVLDELPSSQQGEEPPHSHISGGFLVLAYVLGYNDPI